MGAIQQRSLRGVAREIGISPMGLHGLLQGAEPHARTRSKLEVWYVSTCAAAESEGDVEAGRAAIRFLLRDVSSTRRAAARQRLLACVEELYEAEGRRLPEWLSKLGNVSRDSQER
jgi:hypothetical protein